MNYPLSPLSGYPGGKFKMLPHIMPLVNSVPFDFFCEPFAGGASVFFAMRKDRRRTYILNDLDNNILNFYRQCKENLPAVLEYIENRMVISRTLHEEAVAIIHAKDSGDLERAWATFYLLKTSWLHVFDKGFYPHRRTVNFIHKWTNDLRRRCKDLALSGLENKPALDFIDAYDFPETLFYLDPPYVSTTQFHYGGYTQEDLDNLLLRLTQIKGHFVFSHYNNPELVQWATDNNFKYEIIDTQVSLAIATGCKKRQELLIYNFDKRGLI